MADPEVRPGSEADASGSGSGDQGDRDLDENLFADTLPDLGDSSSPMVAESGVGEANFQDVRQGERRGWQTAVFFFFPFCFGI